MEKKQIETFIKKYSLGGAIDGVYWQNQNNNMITTAMTSDRKLFAQVELAGGASFFSGVDIGIQDTPKLKRMLSPLADNITLTLDVDENDSTRVRQMFIDDGRNMSTYTTAQKDTIDSIPKMKNIPTFEIEVILTPEFIDSYNKAVAAINDPDTLYTLIMSKQKQKMEMVFGYKKSMSDRIALGTTCTAGKDVVKNLVSFNAKHLKEALAANSEVENPILYVSENGLANIVFDKDGYKSIYYQIKIDVED